MKSLILALAIAVPLLSQITSYPTSQIVSGQMQVNQPNGVPQLDANGYVARAQSPSGEYNVKQFGAKGDGATDDTIAIQSAIAAIPTTGGKLVFPAGNYMTSGGFTLSAPITVVGVGQTSRDGSQYGSQVSCTSATCVLFTVTAKVATFRDIGLASTAVAPTSGAAVFVNGTFNLQRVNYDNISVSGFYDDIHVGVGSSWSIRASHIQNPVRYGIYIQNTVHADDGDWIIDGNYFEGGSLTSSTVSAAINIESSGGGKIYGNKVNASFTNGIRMNVAGSVQTLIDHNDIENTTGPPINIIQGWPYISIVANFLNSPAGQPDIQATNLQGFYIGGNDLETYGVTAIPAAIVISTSNNGLIAPNHVNSYFTSQTSTTGGNIVDLSGLVSAYTQETFAIGCTLVGCSDSPMLTFGSNYGGVGYTGSIQSSFAGNGMTFTPPRDLAGKGFVFSNKAGTAKRLFLDAVSGNMELPTAGSSLILKSPDGTCYPVSVPNGGGSLTVGSSVACPY